MAKMEETEARIKTVNQQVLVDAIANSGARENSTFPYCIHCPSPFLDRRRSILPSKIAH